jgi:hypothetical protein
MQAASAGDLCRSWHASAAGVLSYMDIDFPDEQRRLTYIPYAIAVSNGGALMLRNSSPKTGDESGC